MKDCVICKGHETVYDAEGGEISCPCMPTGYVEIIGPEGTVHYRRPANHKDVAEVMNNPAYSFKSYELTPGEREVDIREYPWPNENFKKAFQRFANELNMILTPDLERRPTAVLAVELLDFVRADAELLAQLAREHTLLKWVAEYALECDGYDMQGIMNLADEALKYIEEKE